MNPYSRIASLQTQILTILLAPQKDYHNFCPTLDAGSFRPTNIDGYIILRNIWKASISKC